MLRVGWMARPEKVEPVRRLNDCTTGPTAWASWASGVRSSLLETAGRTPRGNSTLVPVAVPHEVG